MNIARQSERAGITRLPIVLMRSIAPPLSLHMMPRELSEEQELLSELIGVIRRKPNDRLSVNEQGQHGRLAALVPGFHLDSI